MYFHSSLLIISIEFAASIFHCRTRNISHFLLVETLFPIDFYRRAKEGTKLFCQSMTASACIHIKTMFSLWITGRLWIFSTGTQWQLSPGSRTARIWRQWTRPSGRRFGAITSDRRSSPETDEARNKRPATTFQATTTSASNIISTKDERQHAQLGCM